MTKIKFFKEKDYYYGFKASGHADGGEYERIVCAGISAHKRRSQRRFFKHKNL